MLRVTQLGWGRAARVLGCGPRAGDCSQRPGLPLLLQTYTAVYYVLADVLMLSLYFHYKFKKRPSLCEYGDP